MLFTVRCETELAEAIAAVVAESRRRARVWRQSQLEAIPEAATNAEVAAARAAIRAGLAQQRAAGQLQDTRAAIIVPALRDELAERGWLWRRWKPVPADAPRIGRPWGVGDQHWPARVVVEVPDQLGEVLVRAAWWTSAPAVRALQSWHDEHGDSWRGRRHSDRPRVPTGYGPSQADLSRRSQLASRVVTVPEVLRVAAARAVGLTRPSAAAN